MFDKKSVSTFSSDPVVIPNPKTGMPEDPTVNNRVLIIDADFYQALHDNLYRRFDTAASSILYEMGVGYGEMYSKKVDEIGKGKFEAYKMFVERGKRHGYGEFIVPLLEAILTGVKGEGKVVLKNSFFATASGITGKTECWIVAGMIAGAAKKMLNKEVVCTEIMCLSKRDQHCQFIMKSK